MKNSAKRLLIAAAVFSASTAAEAEIAVVVNPEHSLASMTMEQVAAVYLGNDARFRPIDLPESEQLHHWFYFKVTGRDAVQIRIARARMLARSMPPKVVSNSAEAIWRVATDKHAIAYVDLRAVDASVKVVMTVPSPPMLDRLRIHE